jgi:hypothetical protein
MKKINIIGSIYFIVFTFVTLALLLESFLSVSTGAVGAFPWLLLIFLLAIALGVFGIIWASALRAHKAWSWPWGITLVSIGLISGIYSFLVVSILYIITVLFNAFVLYALISEKGLFFPPQSDLAGQRQSLGRTLVVPIIVAVVLILGFGLAYYYISSNVNNRIVPAEDDVFVQTAITDTLVNATNYSMGKGSAQGNYLGYQSTLPPNETPSCSGPLVINISPDGSQMAIFGKSCTAPVYYCSALPIPESSLGSDNNYDQSMPTVPAQFISVSKYDCSPASTSPITIMPPTPIPQQVPIITPASESSTPIDSSILDAYNKAQRELIDFEAIADKYKVLNGSYAGLCTSNQLNIPTLEKQFASFEFICKDSPATYATQISVPGYEKDINWCYDGTYYGSAQQLTGLTCIKE